MKKLFFASVLLVSVLSITSCTHDDVVNEQTNQQEVVPQKNELSGGIVRIVPLEELEKMGIKNPYDNTSLTSRSASALSGYYFLPSNTGVSYFEKKGYAVEITRSWYDANTIDIQPLMYSTTSTSSGTASIYLFDSSYSIISSQINRKVGASASQYPFSTVSLTGDNRVWLLFWPKNADYFMCRY